MWHPLPALLRSLSTPARGCLPGLAGVLLCAAGFAGAAVDPAPGAATGPLRVAVAANFRGAAEQLAASFSASTGIAVQLSSASTGILAAQLRRGAPHDVFLAADRQRPQALVADGLASDAQCYAVGSLVLLGADSLAQALADRRRSIAIANPATAPYGSAAAEVLARPDVAGMHERRVVRGSNVMQALQFHASGAADLALVARSLSPHRGIPIPTTWHSRIEQFAALSAASTRTAEARRFLDHLENAGSRALLRNLGYLPCS